MSLVLALWMTFNSYAGCESSLSPAGLDPDKLEVIFTHESAHSNLELIVRLEGRFIGQVSALEILPGIWRTEDAYVNEGLRGRGIGSWLYLILASHFFQLHPRARLISPPDRSEDATRLWERLTAKGYAHKGKHGSFELLKDKLPRELMIWLEAPANGPEARRSTSARAKR